MSRRVKENQPVSIILAMLIVFIDKSEGIFSMKKD